MTPLRQKMIDEMRVHRLAPSTQSAYLRAVSRLAQHYRLPPDQLDAGQISDFMRHCLGSHLSSSSCRQILNGIHFFYVKTLKWPSMPLDLPRPQKVHSQPDVLNVHEVMRIIAATTNEKHCVILKTIYAAGLRVSEVVALKVKDVDGTRMTLRVTQSKGRRDRLTIVTPTLLTELRAYYRTYHPTDWLFPNAMNPHQHLGCRVVQRVYESAKQRAGVHKRGGVHALRHAFATHQLEAGMPIHRLQRLLGHQSVTTTMRYVHLVEPPSFLLEGARDLLSQAPA